MSKQEHKAVFTADNSDLKNKSKEVTGVLDSIKKKIKAYGAAMLAYFSFTKILQGLTAIIKSTAEFDKALASLSSITGAVGEDLKFYSKEARKMAKETTYSASEVVEAYKLMGSARPELLKNAEALAAVTKEAIVLSEASGLDLTVATESLARAMNQFNAPASEAGKIINVLAAASKEGAAEVPAVAEAIKNMGTAAYMAGVSLEQSVAMIETLAEKGIAGAEAGVMLRNVMLMLQSETDRYNPKIVGMSQALENLAADNLSAADLTKMFGLRNQQAAAILIESRGRTDELTTAVTGTNTAYEQQETNLDTLDAKWKIFTDTLKTATIQSDNFNTKAKTTLDWLTELVKLGKVEYKKNWWGKLTPVLQEYVEWNEELGDYISENTILIKEGIAIKGRDEEVVKKQITTIADYKKQIEELTGSLDLLSIGQGAQAEGIKNQIAQIQALIDKTLEYKTEIKGPSITSDMPTMGGMMMDPNAAAELAEINSWIEKQLEGVTTAYTSAEAAAMAFSEEVLQSSAQGAKGLKDFARVAVDAARKFIAAALAESVATQVKKALVNVPFPFNIIAAGVAGGAAAALFNSLVPKFAAGGAAFGPMLAMVGEAPGISRTNPEYFGTAAQLGKMGIGGGGGTLTARVSRSELLFILNEGQSHNTKNY